MPAAAGHKPVIALLQVCAFERILDNVEQKVLSSIFSGTAITDGTLRMGFVPPEEYPRAQNPDLGLTSWEADVSLAISSMYE